MSWRGLRCPMVLSALEARGTAACAARDGRESVPCKGELHCLVHTQLVENGALGREIGAVDL